MKDNDRYTDIEICTLYRRGSSFSILTQLTGKNKKSIENILINGGYLEMNDERKEKILEKYKEGLSDIAIARSTGYPQSQVSTFLRKQGLPANGKLFGGKAKKQEEKVNEEVSVIEEIKTDQPEVEQNEEKKYYTYSPVNGWDELQKEEPKEEVMENLEKELEAVEVKGIDWKVVSENLEKRIEDGQVKNDKLGLAYITLDVIKEVWRKL